jgi:hypothetical protein
LKRYIRASRSAASRRRGYSVKVTFASVALLFAASQLSLIAQQPGRAGRGAQPPQTARESAPRDLTGYWVSIVTEDWRYRMVTPAKGDYPGLPLNAEARKVADSWDPAKDEAAGNQCKAYGAPAIMRVPGRFHITWQDDNTLGIEADNGMQTRLLHFGQRPLPGTAPQNEPGWQGESWAQWEFAGGARGRAAPGQKRDGMLSVVTTHMRPGYLRKNGVPYSAYATLTEYFTRTEEPNGDSWLFVTTIVEDPVYLTGPFITSTHFKKTPDEAGWDPTPCSAK